MEIFTKVTVVDHNTCTARPIFTLQNRQSDYLEKLRTQHSLSKTYLLERCHRASQSKDLGNMHSTTANDAFGHVQAGVGDRKDKSYHQCVVAGVWLPVSQTPCGKSQGDRKN